MTERLTPQEWYARIQGTQDAILRVLGEIIALSPNRDALVTSVLTLFEPLQPSPEAPRSPVEAAQRDAEETSIQSVLEYAKAALARAAASQADTDTTH